MRNKLDREYFNSIELPPIDYKYYDKNQVDALLVDIRSRALEMNALNKMLLEEIVDLRNRLAERDVKSMVKYTAIKPKQVSQAELQKKAMEEEKAKEEKKAREAKEIEEAVQAAEATRMLCAQMVEDAKQEADKIISDSKAEASKMIQQSERQDNKMPSKLEDDFVMTMAEAFETIKLKNPEDTEFINEQWQNFLVGLYSEKAPDDMNKQVKTIADAVKEISLD